MSKNEKVDFYNVPIVDYLLSINEPIEKQSNNYWQHQQHDSLKINVRKNYFVWNSRQGEDNYTGGVVQYLQIMHSLTLREALTQIEENITGKKIKSFKETKAHYPKHFNYRVKESYVPIEAQRYLVAERKIPNRIIRHFFSLDLISQNKQKEIVFKWYKGDKVVGFDKQGTQELPKEQQEKYKRKHFKYVAPTTQENTYWGFNYLVGDPKHLYFFESSIDLLSYYALHEKELLEKNDFWLMAINGVAVQKVFAFMEYGLKHLDLEENMESLNGCFDNDEAGSKALKKLQSGTFNELEFNDCRPKNVKDWNDELKSKNSLTK